MARVDLPMVCVCDDDGRRAAEARRARVLDDFDGGTGPLIDQLIMAIWHEHLYEIGIYCDMWFGVEARKSDEDSVFVACDVVEDGLVAIWEHLQERAKSDE